MEAQFIKEDGVIIVRFKGQFDFSSIDSFHQTCEKYLMNQKVVFNLEGVHFVGSSGLDSFVKILDKVKSSSYLRMCHVSREFQLVFNSYHLENLEVYENENLAKDSLKIQD